MEQNIFLNSRDKGKEDKIRVVIADDHLLFLEMLGMLLEKLDFVEVAGTASNGMEALEKVAATKAQVLITDIQMPEMDGVELTKELTALQPEVKIIALTALEDDSYIVDMLEAGAKGYLLKTSKKEKLAEAIKSVMEGGNYFCDTTSMKVMRKIAGSRAEIHLPTDASILTTTEKRVVELICRELTSKEIAQEMFISEASVEKHRVHIHAKLGIKNVVGLVMFAARSGLVQL